MAVTLEERLEKIEAMLHALIDRPVAKDYYAIEEFAKLVGRSEFTCREWCRRRRINGEKRRSGRGAHCSWAISHQELQRYRQHGLLPGFTPDSLRRQQR
jgi:hypothetical protein